MSTISTDDLQKLNVAQLKALCKEKNLIGYSKLTKNAIIQRLLDHEGHAKTSSTKLITAPPVATKPPKEGEPSVINAPSGLGQHGAHRTTNDATESSSPTLNPSSSIEAQRLIATASHICHTEQSSCTNASLTSTNAMVSTKAPHSTDPPRKRTLEPSGTLALSSKKRKHTTAPTATAVQAIITPRPSSLMPTIRNLQVSPSNSSIPLLEPTAKANVRSLIADPTPPIPAQPLQVQTMPLKSKRFIPLVIRKSESSAQKEISDPVARATMPPVDISSRKDSFPATLMQNLDFTNVNPILLQPVSHPPSLSQRKRVPDLALFLSAVSTKDLYNCAYVSRLFRYAAYISAVHRLRRDFPGRRLEAVIQQYSPNMTNMWPYLRQRENEVSTRKQAYRASFLNLALKGHNMILGRLWTSPDHVKQITIAVRFLLTRLFFSISITNETGSQLKGMIVDTQELVAGDVWSITVSSSASTEVYYVLAATCEVVGSSAQDLLPLRADWSAYINTQSSPSPVKAPTFSLMSQLKWINHEEYDKGISRVWLKRIQGDGELGAAKRAVAGRYVLACVVANSVSGRWMSSVDMAQEFNGISSDLPKPKQSMRVQLFLPAHHHVESLHFTTSKDEPLHPALAAVQTPGREYYVFRDNGMQVGCEEDGVARVWMQILQCDSYGRPSCN